METKLIIQDFFSFLYKVFKKVPFHPNAIAGAAVIFALMGYLAYGYNEWLSFGVLLFVFFMNATNGIIAHAKNIQTYKVIFIGGVCSRTVEFIIILTLFNLTIPIIIFQKEIWLLIVLFFGTGMSSFIKAYASYTQTVHHARATIMSAMLERMERSALLIAVFFLTLVKSEFYAATVLMFIAILSVLTFIERFVSALNSEG